ncbi:hypothetical protein BS50DRAFT_15867 [Corynespora cassiicola Philippines]|uniref:Uncharacterized protein n=1 Tax=Corynespora cassiicola Philippines TaxID=1448308 RepID=A0A2T2PAN4_CORCC|nr:hypothetical protein BS50DRAFT_15867 [Corynespora cassiicola Philippines]
MPQRRLPDGLSQVTPDSCLDDGAELGKRLSPDQRQDITQWIQGMNTITAYRTDAVCSTAGAETLLDDGADLLLPRGARGLGPVDKTFYDDKPRDRSKGRVWNADIQKAVTGDIRTTYQNYKRISHLRVKVRDPASTEAQKQGNRRGHMPTEKKTAVSIQLPQQWSTFVIQGRHGRVTVIDDDGEYDSGIPNKSPTKTQPVTYVSPTVKYKEIAKAVTSLQVNSPSTKSRSKGRDRSLSAKIPEHCYTVSSPKKSGGGILMSPRADKLTCSSLPEATKVQQNSSNNVSRRETLHAATTKFYEDQWEGAEGGDFMYKKYDIEDSWKDPSPPKSRFSQSEYGSKDLADRPVSSKKYAIDSHRKVDQDSWSTTQNTRLLVDKGESTRTRNLPPIKIVSSRPTPCAENSWFSMPSSSKGSWKADSEQSLSPKSYYSSPMPPSQDFLESAYKPNSNVEDSWERNNIGGWPLSSKDDHVGRFSDASADSWEAGKPRLEPEKKSRASSYRPPTVEDVPDSPEIKAQELTWGSSVRVSERGTSNGDSWGASDRSGKDKGNSWEKTNKRSSRCKNI